MKKLSLFAASAAMFSLSACGTLNSGDAASILGAVLNGNNANTAVNAAGTVANAGADVIGTLFKNATSGANLGNILTSVIGLDKVSQASLIGTWNYKQPGCAFTSQSALASAGGEVVAATVKEKLNSFYNKFGFKPGNTSFAFAQDGTFKAKILGKQVGGTYTFDDSTQAITMNFTLLGIPAYSLQGYVKGNTDGLALLFESKKILGVLQTLGAFTGNSTVSSVTNITKNYDGVRIGFDLTR